MSQFSITEVRITLNELHATSAHKASADIVICGCFAIHRLRIVELKDGSPLVAMPNRRVEGAPRTGRVVIDRKTGDPHHYRDVAHPVTAAARSYMERVVLHAYHYCLQKGVAEVTLDVTATSTPVRRTTEPCAA